MIDEPRVMNYIEAVDDEALREMKGIGSALLDDEAELDEIEVPDKVTVAILIAEVDDESEYIQTFLERDNGTLDDDDEQITAIIDYEVVAIVIADEDDNDIIIINAVDVRECLYFVIQLLVIIT